METTLLETDVLVIGGGSAGLCAAIAAASEGSQVVLLAKPGGNCTSLAAGGFAAVLPQAADDAVEKHIANTLASGAGLGDERLVTIMAERAAEALNTIIQWGVRFYTQPDGSLLPFRSGGHSGVRTYRCVNGNAGQLIRVLSRRAKALGAVFLPGCTIAGLGTEGGRVNGAWGMDRQGSPLYIRSKALVLASGGFAGAYAHSTNPPGMSGDGLEMAFEVGCTLTGLEFVQFMPTTFAFPPELSGRLVNDTLRGEGAVLLNGAHKRFMDTYDPVYGDCAARDILAIAIRQEVLQGRGTSHGGVYLDARYIQAERMAACLGNTKILLKHGVDPHKDLLEVAPAAHFTCGGVRIDTQCHTGVEGLFAAGEVAAGVHGANRLGANALTETLVFGTIAGLSAARHAAGIKAQAANKCAALDERVRQSGCSSKASGPLALQLMHAVQAVFDAKLGVLRSGQELAQAAEELLELAKAAKSEANAGYAFPEGLCFAQIYKMAMLGHKTAVAAEQRVESRGTHFRSDYPEQNTAFAKHREFSLQNPQKA